MVKLKDEVAKRYDVGKKAVQVFQDTQLGRIDLEKIDLATANNLALLRPEILIKKNAKLKP